MTAAFLGGVTFARLDTTVSPNAYETIEEAASISNIGQVNPLVDVTSHDSTSREYIAGLPDGSEITIESNRVHTASSIQDKIITDVENKATQTFRLTMIDTSVSPNLTKTYTFSGVVLGYQVAPSFDDKHMVTYTIKISGNITRA